MSDKSPRPLMDGHYDAANELVDALLTRCHRSPGDSLDLLQTVVTGVIIAIAGRNADLIPRIIDTIAAVAKRRLASFFENNPDITAGSSNPEFHFSTLDEAWGSFERETLDGADATDAEYRTVKRVFYAGCAAMLQILQNHPEKRHHILWELKQFMLLSTREDENE